MMVKIMKAVLCEKKGPPDVLKIKEVEKPIPKDNEILIRNYASSINTGDILYRSGKLPPALFWSLRVVARPFLKLFLKPPKIPGSSYAGEIVEVGENVTKWNKGDRIYGFREKGGALAEYRCLPEDFKSMAKMPINLSFEEAGAVPGGVSPAFTALTELIELKENQKILIIGASGGIGTFAVQIAKIFGAEVTGVCGSSNVDMVKRLKADFVIDYTQGDYTKNPFKKYDFIYDVVAAINYSQAKRLLNKEGIYISNNPVNAKRHIFYMALSKRFKTKSANEGSEVLNKVREWIEAGKLRPVIDKVFPLEQVPEAHRLYETGHAKGRIVVSVK